MTSESAFSGTNHPPRAASIQLISLSLKGIREVECVESSFAQRSVFAWIPINVADRLEARIMSVVTILWMNPLRPSKAGARAKGAQRLIQYLRTIP